MIFRWSSLVVALRCLAWLFIMPLAAFSAAGDATWFMTDWQVPDGLPNNNVAGVVPADEGHLWLAMPDSIARFDGVRFERFQPVEFGASPGRRIRALLRTRDGALWVGVDRDGAICLKNGTAEAFARDTPTHVDGLTEDGDGAVWVSCGVGDVHRIKDGRETVFGAADGLPAGPRCSLAADNRGRLWFARGGQVGVFRDGRFVTLVRTGGVWTRLAASSTGGMWLCSGFKLARFDERTGLQDCGTFEPAGVAGETCAILENRSGAVWLGTTTCGLFRYDGVGFENVPTSDREVRTLFEDRDGNIWAGTAGGGLDRVCPRGIELEQVGSRAFPETIQSLTEDAQGKLWAATTNGLLAQRTTAGWRVVREGALGGVQDVMCVAADQSGTLWIGTVGRQLAAWRDGRLTTWGPAAGISARTIRVLCPTRSGDLWIGTEGPVTLLRLRAGELRSFALPTAVSHIRAIVEDANGVVWIGAEKNVLLRVAGDAVVDETALTAATSRSIRCLYPDADGGLWIGLGGNGVGWLRHGRFAVVRSDRGLFNDDVSQIVGDGRGWLWFGSDRGLFKVRQSELQDVGENRARTVQSVSYGKDQGLSALQATYGNWPGALRTHDGRLWIPMRSGLAVVDPARLRSDVHPLPVVLDQVAVDDVPIASYAAPIPVTAQRLAGVVELRGDDVRLRVAPRHRRVAFRYAALSLNASENILFRYRLDGFDDDWSAPTSERIATYPRLDPGRYRFRVVARNADGIWNNAEATVAFTVEPFLWQAWWFRLLAVLLFTGGVAAIVRYVSFRRLQAKVRVLKEQAALDKERARIARDIHDDVGGRLTRIMLLSGLALRERTDPEKAGARVNEIAASARQVIKSLDETVWAINPRNDTLPDLVNYLGQFALEFTRTADLRCHLELPDHPPRWTVTAEARHNLFLAVKEALNNIVRHAGDCEVRLVITPDPDALRITVADNGRGFSGSSDDPGADGLRNMRLRMADIGGECRVESAIGAGTRVVFTYPWPAGTMAKPAAASNGAERLS